MSYDSWKLRAPEDEPGYDAGEPDPDPVHCRGCGDYLGDNHDPDGVPGHAWNGWFWCSECIKTVQPVQADLERSARMDIERDEMNERRR